MDTIAMLNDTGADRVEERHPPVDAVADRQPRAPAALVEAARLCRELADEICADGFGLYFLSPRAEAKRLVPVLDTAFPGVSLQTRALCTRVAERFAQRLAETPAPLWWRPDGSPPFLNAAARCWAMETESPVADTAGIAFPVAVERGRQGAVIFHGEAMAIGEAELCDLHARCFTLFSDVTRLRSQDGAKTPPVSKREIECLRLTANGMTSEEIAGALGLSVHTANQYMTNSTHKLNAVNRIHAVAKALRCGLID